MLEPTAEEIIRRDEVLAAIVVAVDCNQTIRLPAFSHASMPIAPNPYGGAVGRYRYQFEGEDDLLHLSVTCDDSSALSAEEGQVVAALLMPGMPPGLIWIRPGEFSQHFYCGHDDLVRLVRT